MNLANLLSASAQRVPNSPAMVSGTKTITTYREFAARASGMARYLVDSHGIERGQKVAIYASNSPEYLDVLFAIWWIGATAIPLSAMLHPREVAGLLEDSGASLCIVSDDKASELSGTVLPSPAMTIDDIRVADTFGLVRPAEVLSSDSAWLFYTSGTTGKPKGAVLTHGNLLAMSLAYLADVEPVDERSGLLHLALMSHAGGLFSLPFIARGARQVLPELRTADPSETWSLLGSHSRLSFFAPPVLLRRLIAAPEAASTDVTNLGTVLLGAAPVLVNDLITSVGIFGPRVWNGYGQGESPCTITALDSAQIAKAVRSSDMDLLRSVGCPRIATEVRVADDSDTDLPEGEAGEIIVRGPTVMTGYLNRPEESAEALNNGWLHTGDIGRFDNGYLTLLDRSKDLVITGGANVYPREVEDVLMLHDSVGDVAVIGFPDEEWGERVVAFIVPAEPGNLVQHDLEEHCLAQMARYKRPKEYHVLASLPRNGAGKVLKSELRAMLAGTSEKE